MSERRWDFGELCETCFCVILNLENEKGDIFVEKKTREEAIEELSLMLMYLTRFQDHNEFHRYQEVSWKGYDFGTLDQLEEQGMLIQPRKSKCVYITEAGKERAKKLLAKYQLPDKELYERFSFRTIWQEEAEQAADIEGICFPPHEACSKKNMLARIAKASELFLVAEDRETGKIAGFLNGIATDEEFFRDEFFTDADLHDPNGRNIMILGLDVLPEYRRQGLARELVYRYLCIEAEKDRKKALLTCLPNKVKMYRKMGFFDRGTANSTWGGEQWHEMCYTLNI